MIGDNFNTETQKPIDRSFSGSYSHRASTSSNVVGLSLSKFHSPAKDGRPMPNDIEQEMLYRQSLIYAEDMAKIYEQEKLKRKALEKANAELTSEVHARRLAEEALLEAHRDLEKKIEERTQALSETNKRLQEEISRREDTEEKIRASLKEKEILLAEIHHRVKNNLQIISSLLALQAGLVSDASIKGVLEDSRNRVRSIALIHEHIYRSKDLAKIDFHEYLGSLASSLLKNHAGNKVRISVDTDEGPVFLRMDKALPCSLIINELVTNCLKHAFLPGEEGEIQIQFRRGGQDDYLLTVRDNGRGFPEDVDYRSTKSLGLQLVLNLAEAQLQGSLELVTGGGTEFRILFPEVRKARMG